VKIRPELIPLVSSADPGKLGDLRAELREGLINFLVRNYPESLPRSRNMSSDDQRLHAARSKSTNVDTGP
jgi:hypothetical protein